MATGKLDDKLVFVDDRLRTIIRELGEINLGGVPQKNLAMAITQIGVMEKVMRKLRADTLKAMIEGAKQGTIDL